MPWLFERLIGRLLAEAGGRVRVLEQQTCQLDRLGQLSIRPDLVFVDGHRVVGVADTKYKLLDESGRFPNADAYQLVTYCARLGLDTGHLIYAAGDPRPEPFDIRGAGTRLVVHSVDLTQPVEEMETTVQLIFDAVTADANRHHPLASGVSAHA